MALVGVRIPKDLLRPVAGVQSVRANSAATNQTGDRNQSDRRSTGLAPGDSIPRVGHCRPYARRPRLVVGRRVSPWRPERAARG
jgi:hypothetical protein